MFPPHRYYYLHNFERALAWVRERYGDLLAAAEHTFLTQFEQLPQQSRALMVRLLMRRGPWFLESKLAYPEIPEIREAASFLLELGWLDARHPMRLDELFSLHTKAELLPLFEQSPIHGGMLKAQMLQALRTEHGPVQAYAEWNPQSPLGAWCVKVGEQCERFRLMFFGNLYQGWSEFVLADLGVFQYEQVPFDSASRAFGSQQDVDCYLAIDRCRQALDSSDEFDPQALLLEAAGCLSANLWLETRRAKLLLRIGQACERAKDWEHAEHAYAQSRYPGARHRRMRVYERAHRLEEALALAQAAQADPESEEENQRVARMLPRVMRGLGLVSAHRSRRASFKPQGRIDVELHPPVSPTAVEYLLRDYWNDNAAPVFYVENALFNSLFGLLCWPAIFAPLPGAFFHPFQSGPADLGAPDFAQRRAAALDTCFAQLDDGRYREVIRQRFVDKKGVQSPFVFWGCMTQQVLDLALTCIPPDHLKLCFIRMLRDLKSNRTGFPDLIRFWPAQQRYELVEVKGPGDKLQDNQVRWLQYFSENGIPASVCHVSWHKSTEDQPIETVGAAKAAT